MRKENFVLVLFLLMLCVSQAICAQGLTIESGQEYWDKCLDRNSIPGRVKKYVDSKGRYRQDMKSNDGGNVSDIKYRIDESKDWSIDATVARVNSCSYGKSLPFVGIAFGYKDFDNYSFLCVNGKEYVIEVVRNGIKLYRKNRAYYYRKAYDSLNTRIKIFKQGDQVFFALNGNVVDTIGVYKLSGDIHGLYTSGKGDFAIYDFKIDNDVEQMTIPTSNGNTGGGTAQSSADGQREDMKIVGSGTGFLIDKRGYLATNHHVVEDAGAIGVCLRVDGEWRTYDGVVIKDDPTNDLAIIKIEDPNFKEFTNLPYAFSFETEDIASEIFTLGYPQVQVMGSDVKYTTGVVNAITGIQGDPTHYQISAHIDHGNSGGPLFNEKGYIIGITDSGLNKAVYGDVNYAVKSTYLKVLADALPKKLEFAHDQSIALKKRTEQIKTLSQYVALILIAK